jgi:hypothetical protein
MEVDIMVRSMGPISEVDMVGAVHRATYLTNMNTFLCNTRLVANFKIGDFSLKKVAIIFCDICTKMCGNKPGITNFTFLMT